MARAALYCIVNTQTLNIFIFFTSAQIDDEGKLQLVKMALEGLAFNLNDLSGAAACISAEGDCAGDLAAIGGDVAAFGAAVKGIMDDKAAGTITAGDAMGAVGAAGVGLADTLKGEIQGDVGACFIDSEECKAAEAALSGAIVGFLAAIAPEFAPA